MPSTQPPNYRRPFAGITNRAGVEVRVFQRRDLGGYLLGHGWRCTGCGAGAATDNARQQAESHAGTCNHQPA